MSYGCLTITGIIYIMYEVVNMSAQKINQSQYMWPACSVIKYQLYYSYINRNKIKISYRCVKTNNRHSHIHATHIQTTY